MPYTMTQEHRRRIGDSVSRVRSGKPLSLSHKLALRGSHTNREKVECVHCNKKYAVNVIKRHENSCLNKKVIEIDRRTNCDGPDKGPD